MLKTLKIAALNADPNLQRRRLTWGCLEHRRSGMSEQMCVQSRKESCQEICEHMKWEGSRCRPDHPLAPLQPSPLSGWKVAIASYSLFKPTKFHCSLRYNYYKCYREFPLPRNKMGTFLFFCSRLFLRSCIEPISSH